MQFLIGLVIGLMLGAPFVYAQYYEPHYRGMPGQLSPQQQQEIYNLQQQLNMLPRGPQLFVQPGDRPC